MKNTTKQTPIPFNIVSKHIAQSGLASVGQASIRELKKLVNDIENESGEQFIRMEMGVPGLPASPIGVDAEIAALKQGVAAVYPEIYGSDEFKKEAARFVKMFLNISVNGEGCLPVVGSMQGAFAAFMTVNRLDRAKDTTLFIDPGFPVQKHQMRVLNQKFETFDVYDNRGEKLRAKLELYLSKGNISSIIYSNPNNPSWVCLTESELKIVAEVADKHGAVVIEDLAYFCMDFRKDYSQPGRAPYQSTVARYTKNYILLISGSKAFSYAGQRIGMMIISDALYHSRFPDLKQFYSSDVFGRAMIFGTLYPLSAGVCHSAQCGFTAMLKAASDGRYNFVAEVREYGEKARIMKKIFTENGFKLVYDKDGDEPIADGFYFTISYPEFTGEELIEELLYYGVSAISLTITGSSRTEGIRACVSLVQREQFPVLEERMRRFHRDHVPTRLDKS